VMLYQRYCWDCERAFEAYEPEARLCDECEMKLAEAQYEAASAEFDTLPPEEQERQIAATTAALLRALDTVAPKGGRDADHAS
jgi:hypothetical protein